MPKNTRLFILIVTIPFIVVVSFAIHNLKEVKCAGQLNNENILNPNAPKETIQYGRLIGEWNCTLSNLDNTDNSWKESKATWIFRYILDGYAVQDFWINHGSNESPPNSKILLGTNIRIYNPEGEIWKCAWMENGKNTLSGIWESYQNENGELILHDSTGDWEIVFYNIIEDSFDWRWDYKQEDGSMKTVARISAKARN